MRTAKASVELATAPQFDVIIKNYDLPGSSWKPIIGKNYVSK
jgi:guanylate kinase